MPIKRQHPARGDRETAAGKPIVGLNAQLLSLDAGYRNAGLSRYIHNLMRYLPASAPDLDLVGYVGQPGIEIPGWQMRHSAWGTTSPLRRILWEQTALPLAMHRDRIDLLHATVNVGPVLCPAPLVLTIHDLTFLRYPELFPGGNRAYLQHMTRNSAHHAARVIVDSASTGRDVGELLGVSEDRITVVYPGLNPERQPVPSQPALAAFRERNDLAHELVLCVATLEPRKNIGLLLEAWGVLAGRGGSLPTLAVVGGKGWFYDQLEARVSALRLGDAVRFVGYVSDEELALWYAATDVFVFPSLYEGFGFTPLEAMAQRVPVIVSDRSSLPEVVGDAGLLLPPDDPTAWAGAITDLLDAPERRAAMSTRGSARAAQFTWVDAARQTAEVYRQVLHEC